MHRLFKCDSLKGITSDLETKLKDDVNKLTNPVDMYHAYLLNKNAKTYGLKSSQENFLSQRVKDELLKQSDKTDLSNPFSERAGLSVEGLQVAVIYSSL